MENSLKQRIVGAIVLIGLAVIFLPSILKEKTHRQAFQSQIPAKPIDLVEPKISEAAKIENHEVSSQLDRAEQKAKEQKTKIADNQLAVDTNETTTDNSAQVTQQPDPAEKVTDPGKNEQVVKSKNTTIGETFKDAAWVIQVASFSNKDNAEKLIAQLKATGYKAYRRDGKNQKKQSIYRIFVGPYIEKASANKELSNISKLSQSKAVLLPFDPLKH